MTGSAPSGSDRGGHPGSDDARTDEPVDRAGVDAAVRRLRRALIDGGPPALNGADVVLALDELTDRPTPWAWWTANRTIDRLRAALSASRERERATAARAARLTEAGNDLADAVNSGWTDLHELHELKRAWREAVRGDAPAVCVHPELDGPCSGCATP